MMAMMGHDEIQLDVCNQVCNRGSSSVIAGAQRLSHA